MGMLDPDLENFPLQRRSLPQQNVLQNLTICLWSTWVQKQQGEAGLRRALVSTWLRIEEIFVVEASLARHPLPRMLWQAVRQVWEENPAAFLSSLWNSI